MSKARRFHVADHPKKACLEVRRSRAKPEVPTLTTVEGPDVAELWNFLQISAVNFAFPTPNRHVQGPETFMDRFVQLRPHALT